VKIGTSPVQPRFGLSWNDLGLVDDRRVLRDLRGPGGLERHPSLSVVLAARDEEWSVAEGVGSMLAQKYLGEVEVIASNDLSADRTGEILGPLDLLTRLPSQVLGAETPWWYASLHPIGDCILIYAMLRSDYTTMACGGVEWRGIRYP
jgi:hypothetical protein